MLDTLAIRKNAPIIKVPDEKGGKTMQSINEKLVHSLWDVNHRMRSLHDGKASQGRILVILHERGAMTQKALMEHLHIQPGSASEVLAKLENSGLITRTLMLAFGSIYCMFRLKPRLGEIVLYAPCAAEYGDGAPDAGCHEDAFRGCIKRDTKPLNSLENSQKCYQFVTECGILKLYV